MNVDLEAAEKLALIGNPVRDMKNTIRDLVQEVRRWQVGDNSSYTQQLIEERDEARRQLAILREVPAREPYSAAHLICPNCDSTYCMPDEQLRQKLTDLNASYEAAGKYYESQLAVEKDFRDLEARKLIEAWGKLTVAREALELIAAPLPEDYGWATAKAREALAKLDGGSLKVTVAEVKAEVEKVGCGVMEAKQRVLSRKIGGSDA